VSKLSLIGCPGGELALVELVPEVKKALALLVDLTVKILDLLMITRESHVVLVVPVEAGDQAGVVPYLFLLAFDNQISEFDLVLVDDLVSLVHLSVFVFCFVVVKGAPSPSVHALLPCAVALTRLFDSGHLADVQPVAPTQ